MDRIKFLMDGCLDINYIYKKEKIKCQKISVALMW